MTRVEQELFTFRDHQQPIRARSRGGHPSRVSGCAAPCAPAEERLWQGPIIQQLLSVSCQPAARPRAQRSAPVISLISDIITAGNGLCFHLFNGVLRCHSGRWERISYQQRQGWNAWSSSYDLRFIFLYIRRAMINSYPGAGSSIKETTLSPACWVMFLYQVTVFIQVKLKI